MIPSILWFIKIKSSLAAILPSLELQMVLLPGSQAVRKRYG